ncbi:MAG: hypothetical protein ABIW76_12460 [Fibrobacteria bacterium]
MKTLAHEYAKVGPGEEREFQEPYLRRVFGWMGIDDSTNLEVLHKVDHRDQQGRIKETQEALQAKAERWLAEFDAEYGPGDSFNKIAA